MQAILENVTTKFKQYFPECEVISDNLMYYTITLNISDYQDGNYQITLMDDSNRVVAQDLVKIGDFKTTNKIEYKVEKKFTQYVRK